MFVEAARHRWHDKEHATRQDHPPRHTKDVIQLLVRPDSYSRHRLTRHLRAASGCEPAEKRMM